MPPPRATGWLDSLRRVRFEKWQALGNDYAIVEESELPFELTPERIRRFCAPHTVSARTGSCSSARPPSVAS